MTDEAQVLAEEKAAEEKAAADKAAADEAAAAGKTVEEVAAEKKAADEAAAAAAAAEGGWLKDLDPEFREDASIKKYKTPNELAKAHKHLVSKLGADKIVKPKDDWTEDQWAEFYKESGRPETAESYEFSAVELPEGMTLAGEDKEIKEMAHKHGLSQRQADGMYKDYLEMEKAKFEQEVQTLKEGKEAAENELRKELGAAYEKNVKLAADTFMSVADDAMAERFVKEGWGNDPSMIKLFAKLGKERSEDAIGGKTKVEGVLTPDEAQKEINKINGDKTHPYWNKDHAEHQDAKDRMDDLYAMAHPEEKSDIITE